MFDLCASVLSCARENLLSLAHKYLLPPARDHFLPILKEAVNMIRGVPNDVIAHMKHELETIEDAIHYADKLADAEEGDDPADGTREKMKQLIEASFRIQDLIDEYIIHEEQQLPDPGCVDGASDYVKTKMLRLQIAHDIQHIKSQLNEIKDTASKKDHEVSNSSATNPNATLLQNLRENPKYMSEAEVVGFEKPRDKLVDWLVKGRDELTVVSVVAMGGQGKTTLAKKVFDSKEVVARFEYRIWITVSKSYNKEDLLRGILRELKVNPQKIHEMKKESLVDEVRNYLQEKRYVVVFDDVWNSPFWADIKFAMSDKQKGCRILITTRIMDVATSCRENFVEIHELKGLDDEQSLKLFNKKAFFDLEEVCPPNLIDISSKIVKKCGGLPLAIVVIGGLLRKNRNAIDWSKFNKNIKSKLKKDFVINKILVVSYHDLSYNLKSSLLYFGIYPEDCKVDSKRLIQQWIAEGFVKEEEGMTLEEVAEGYLIELIDRSLVQVVSTNIDGRAKSCRVHDLVHDMILKKFEDLSFCKNISDDGQSALNGMVRRLSVAANSDNLLESIENSQVRSLHVYKPKTLSESFVRTIPTKYRQLKVLNLDDDDGLLEVPKNLGSLSHLKYFRFNRKVTPIKFSLPKSIGMLGKLETLDLTNTNFTDMPKEICKLKKLRHFKGWNLSLIQLKDGIAGMTSLQTLSGVYLDDHEDENDNRVVELIKELGKLKQLRELCLKGVKLKYVNAISSLINEMQQLEKLCMEPSSWEASSIDIDLNSPPPPMLRKVKFKLILNNFPMWISKLQNLAVLTVNLKNSQMDVMELLEGMPSLLSLHISCFHPFEETIQRLHFKNKGFKSLNKLRVGPFDKLQNILIDEGALGSLKMLNLHSLPNLRMLPTGIQHLQKLEFLTLTRMSSGFKQCLLPHEGKEHWIFKQVSSVEIER